MTPRDLVDSDLLELAQETIAQEIEALVVIRSTLGDAFLEAACLLDSCQGIVWVTGVGTSAAVGGRFAHILTCCGQRAMLISPADGLHGHSAVFQPEDLLVAISRGGESREVNEMVAIAQSRDCPTLAMVHDTGSTLARTADHLLPTPSPADYELLGYLATTSTVVVSAICDALCTVAAVSRGRSSDDLREIHPGGAVGHQLAEDRDPAG